MICIDRDNDSNKLQINKALNYVVNQKLFQRRLQIFDFINWNNYRSHISKIRLT